MITEVHSALTMAGVAAQAAAGALPVGDALTAGAPSPELADLDLAAAVLVAFSGSSTGELALLVDAELAGAMQGSTIGQLDLAQALAPTLAAIAVALGPVVLGAAQTVDTRLALARIAAHDEIGGAPLRAASLTGAVATRAAVALGLDRAPASAVTDLGATAAPGATAGAPAFDRLDLLRGVEMAASAELGRARMTVNDLLSLRNGSVIELDRAAGEAADLFVNGRLIARGEVVVVDENYALRITQIVTEDRS